MYCADILISINTEGSRRVLISPKLSPSPAAIFLNIRLIILPERVFGRPLTNCILSDLEIAPTFFLTNSFISIRKAL